MIKDINTFRPSVHVDLKDPRPVSLPVDRSVSAV